MGQLKTFLFLLLFIGSFNVFAQHPPTVSLTGPADNATYTAPASITINADAADSDGTISSVEFYSGTTLLVSDASSPYSYAWTNVPAGTYTITAVARDNSGEETASSAITIVVDDPSNVLPTVAITSPATMTNFNAPATVTITADAADADGSINSVAFYNGSNLLGTDVSAPFSYEWSNIPVGSNLVLAVATDNSGGETVSTSIYIVVNASVNVEPIVSITAPADNAVFTAPANVTLTAVAEDSDGTVSKVDFYTGSTLLGSDASSPYSYTWSNLPVGNYSVVAVATDNGGAVTTSSMISFTVGNAVNVAPTVTITSPANNATFIAPASITINADAADADGTVTSVAFYNGTTLLVSDASSPYSYTWTNAAAGTYTITARATDNDGDITTSSPILIVVNAPVVNVAPTVSISGPANNTTFTAPANITINADAADTDGTVSSVEFYNGTTLLVSDASSPYRFAWMNVAAGTYTVTARAIDNDGEVTTSSPITLVVNAPVNVAPTVTITSPANNATFTAPASITISADATDADGTINSVAFYSGTTLLVSDVSSPYSYTWVNAAAGTYTITAIAADNGGTTSSTAITIVVNPAANDAPTVNITSPANNAIYTEPATITINATAADTDGTISNVYFYNGSDLIGSDATAPYSYELSNLAAGTYTLTARATDNSGATSISTDIIVVVNPSVNVNDAPTVSITNPANNDSLVAPASITINANAADSDGTVSNVYFYNGSDLIGSDASAPYTFVWSNVAAGTYTLTARATDNEGATTSSAAITVFVTGVTPTGVTIQGETACSVNGTLNESANTGFRGTGYVNTIDSIGAAATWAVNSTTAQTVSLGIRYATATTSGRAMSLQVNGTTQVATIPFANTGSGTTWAESTVQINLVAGANTLSLVSLTAEGSPYLDELFFNSTTVSADSCTSTPNTAPSVSITSPANNFTYSAPASINIVASASDADGTVSSVQLFNGSTLLINDLTSPYNYAWTNVAAGTYILTAVATDNDGAVTTSSPITVIVNPEVSTNGLTIQAETACNVDGTSTETANEGFNGTSYVNTTDAVGATAAWSINSSSNQVVVLTIRYAHATSAGRAMSLRVNGTTQVANIPFPSTGSSAPWTTTDVQVALSTGTNTIELVSLTDEGSPYIDELTFVSTTVAVGACPTPVTFQAETACSVDGTLNETANGGFNGTGYVNTSDIIGAKAVWVFNSLSSQTVSLGIRYAHTTSAGRPMSLSVNGTTHVSNIAFASTGGNSTWLTSTVQVNLAAGTNTIELISLSDEGSPYIDELTFGSSTVSAGTCPVPVSIQAETACSVDGSLNENANSGFSGTGYVNTSDLIGAKVVWILNSPTSQTVSLGIRYAHTTSAGRAMSLRINGATQVSSIAFPSTGDNSTWLISTVQVSLASGTNTVELISLTDEGSPYIDQLTFGSSTVSAGTCPIPVTIQAENACSVVGTLNEIANSGFRGTGYINTNDAVGAKAVWAVNSPTSQSVSLTIRYAHTTLAGRPMSLSVNGLTQVANIAFPNSPNNTTWVTSTVQVNLASGDNILELVSLTDEGSPYIDELVFGSATVSASACPTVSGVTVQAETACFVNGELNESIYSGFRGTGYVNTSDSIGAAVSWVVNSQSDQTINLEIRYTHSTLVGRSMALNVNGVNQIADLAFSSSISDSVWITTIVQVSLLTGDNTIELVSLTSAGSPYIDELTYGATTVTEGTCPTVTPVIIQAETACSVDGTMNETAHTGFNGTGYFNTSDSIGASASYVINSTTAQTVSLGIRYATSTAAGRAMSLSVNGATQVSNIPFANSAGAWIVSTVQINLTAGENTVTLVATTDEGSPYVDELIFGSTTVSAGTCPTTNPNPNPGDCIETAIPSASQWTVTNDWSDQYAGSGVSNTSDALSVNHRAWGYSSLWIMETGKTFAIQSGTTYTISFDLQNDLQLPVNSIDVGFGTGTNWNGPRLAQSLVNVSTTDSATRRTVTITSNVNATVFLALKLNWTSQVNNQAIALINNISICPSATPQLTLSSVPAYETGANPFVDQTTAKVIFDNTVPMQLRVLDLSGMVQLESDAYTTNQDFYVGSGLPAGTYIVQAVFEGQVITFRLIKN